MKSGSRIRAGTRLAFTAAALLFSFSCTRMPTAPRISVVLEGRISGPADEPLEDALLWFVSDDNIWTGFHYARTDSLGLYSVQLLEGTYRVEVDPPDTYRTPVHRGRITLSEKRNRYDIGFKGFRVTGRVTGPSGESIDSGSVSASLQGSYDGASSPLNEGHYSLLLPAGTYSLVGSDANYWSGFPARRMGDVSIKADTTIDLQLIGIQVSGTVIGPEGLPMEGVAVEARYVARNHTNIDGTYRLYVPPGTYRIWFRPPYPFYIFPRVTDSIPINSPVSIDGDLRGFEWAGTVRRLGTGDPASGITLGVTQVADELQRRGAIRSGSQGEFRFILEPGHSYNLSTYDPVTNERRIPLQGIAATSDTTFEIFLP